MKDVLAIIGISTMLALSLVLAMTFFTAYGSPTKTVRVHINNYGEADAELLLLGVLLPLNIISTFYVSRRLLSRSWEERMAREVEIVRRQGIDLNNFNKLNNQAGD